MRNDQYFKTWLTRILINECYKIINQNKKIVYFENISQEKLIYRDTYTDFEITDLVKKLEKDLKETVVLYYFEDRSIEDISKILHIPKGTVKSRLSRARKILSDKLVPNIEERRENNGR